MTLNQLIQSTRPPISELVTGLKQGDIFVDDSFQRRLVWTERQKVRLIDTVLSGYPMPEIYLWLQPANEENGSQRKSVVDGQQRLTAMSQFTSNEFPMSKRHLDKEGQNKPYVGLFWKDFSADLKRSFWEYVLNIRSIPSDVSSDEISDIFTRLNETDKSLNPQELRNAAFNGEFIRASENVTGLDSFARIRPFSIIQTHRMKDIEFASGMLLFLRRGLVEENTKSINEAYDEFNDEYAEGSDDVATIDKFFIRCSDIYFQNGLVRELFSKPVHLFTLFVSERYLLKQGLSTEQISDKLPYFSISYVNDQNSNDNEIIAEYRKGASSRTRSKSSRQLRMSSLIKVILGGSNT